jgi:hypothetical protein
MSSAAPAPGLGSPRPGRTGCGTRRRPACWRAGGTLAEIGQVLRRTRPSTTAIYAKADVLALSPLARPWPGSPR